MENQQNVPSSMRGELINEQSLQNNQAKIDKLSDQLRETYSQVYPDGFGELEKKVARLNDIFRKGEDSVIQERSDELIKYDKATQTKIYHTKMASLHEEINKNLAEKEKKVEKLKALIEKFRQIGL